MLTFLKRGSAAVKVKNCVTHWMAAMENSFRQVVKGYRFDETTLRIASASIIVAAIMERGISSPRLMSAVADHIMEAYGLNEEEIRLTPALAQGMLKGMHGKELIQWKLDMLKDVCPGFPFTIRDTEWFGLNLAIISEQLDTSLSDAIHVLSK